MLSRRKDEEKCCNFSIKFNEYMNKTLHKTAIVSFVGVLLSIRAGTVLITLDKRLIQDIIFKYIIKLFEKC